MNVQTNYPIKCTIALAGLHEVFDPEVGLSVVDMGLIYQLDFEEEEKKIFGVMTLSTQFCPMGQSIIDGVRNNLVSNFPDYDVQVSVTFYPPWSNEMISQEGHDFLNR